MAYNGVTINHIVATDLSGCIGKDGKMPWHIPADLKRFRKLTDGGVVIMGRKTYESIGGRTLPNRLNIVVTRNEGYKDESITGAIIVNSIDDALELAVKLTERMLNKSVWVMGGAEIYKQTMKYVDAVEHTVVDMKFEGGDAFYGVPPLPFRLVELSNTMTDEKSGLTYRYSKHVRFIDSRVGND